MAKPIHLKLSNAPDGFGFIYGTLNHQGEHSRLLAVSSGLFGVEAGLVCVMGMLLFDPQRRPSFHPDPRSSDAVVHSSCQGWPAP